MIAAQLVRWGDDVVDIVGVGATRDEAMAALAVHWSAWIGAAPAEWGGTTDPDEQAAWLRRIADGDDNELSIRWVS